MNYEILIGLLSLYQHQRSRKDLERCYDGLYELLFRYNYSWININESWDLTARVPYEEYPYKSVFFLEHAIHVKSIRFMPINEYTQKNVA